MGVGGGGGLFTAIDGGVLLGGHLFIYCLS